MKHLKIVVILVILGSVIASYFWQRHAIACDFLPFNSSFSTVSPYHYVSADLSHDDIQAVQNKIAQAQLRVDNTFGKRIAQPYFIVTHSPALAATFKSNATGSSFSSILAKQCIVLGPKGQNVDVIAHELVHAEVGERLGLHKNISENPVWFNEGIALVVDHRAPFLPQNIDLSEAQVQQVKTKFWGLQFFDGKNTHQHYLAARLAVNDVPPKQVYSMLDDIVAGTSFDLALDKITKR